MKRTLHRIGSSLLLCAACLLAASCEGPPGPAGSKGNSCTVTAGTGGGAVITCEDGTSVTVPAGTPGINGTNGDAGANGTSCTVTNNPDAGTKTISCTDGTSITVTDGVNGVDANAVVNFATLSAAELALLDMSVTVTGVTNVARPVVTFTVRDQKGTPVKGIAPANFSGLAILQLVPGNATNGVGNDTWVSHITNCATCTASTETASATSLVDQGNGTYVYTFAKDIINPTAYDGGTAIAGVAFDANAPHRFGLRLAASGNPYRPVDAVYDYVPATGANVTGQNDKVSTAACLVCHMQWRAQANNAGGTIPFHSGQRYEAQYCVVCHNDQRKWSGNLISGNAMRAEPTIDGAGNMTPPPLIDGGPGTSVALVRGQAIINIPVWAHKIHMGRELYLHGPYAGLGTEINEIEFPQSPSNCATCHKGAAMADNWKNKPSRRACGACHDDIDFSLATGSGHLAGQQLNDNSCAQAGCHTPTAIATKHLPVDPPAANSILIDTVNGSANTHASWLGNPNNPPAGATVIRYAMPTGAISTIDAGAGLGWNAAIKFKFMTGDAGIVFNTWDGGNEMVDNFIGSPSAYCAWAVPQDGITAPADFNASASAYLRNVWRGTATGTGAGTISASPDTNGYYTVTLTGVVIPATAKMLTCGLGYSYNVNSSQPMTQTNVPGYPYDGGTRVGGLAIPPANIWQVAPGFTGRRGQTASTSQTGAIVNASKCNTCHNQLGTQPSFHAGQRNDGPTCAWCHTQNRASSGWSAGSESFVHAIHGAGKRTVDFNWHALSATEGFYEVTYPGRPQMCEGCHNPGYYDFSASWYNTAGNVESRLVQTVATGTYDNAPLRPDGGVNTSAWTISPYVIADAGYNYGSGPSYSSSTGVLTNGAATNLVNSPITNVCTGCHDADRSIAHMEANGGSFYAPRSVAVTQTEQCLICHGPNKVAAIRKMHYE